MASFNDLTPRLQIATFVVLSVLAGFAAWQFLLSPEQLDLAQRENRLTTVKAEVEKAAAVAQQLPRITQEIAKLEQALDQSTAVLPDEKDAQDVLRQLHELANDATLSLSHFTPKPVVARTQYAEWPIELGLEGGFHDLGRFFDMVAGLPLLISVSDLHLQATTQPSAKGSVTVTCVATTYVFNRALMAAAAPPDPKGVKR
jgi:type IV pilus assembly protein PilO